MRPPSISVDSNSDTHSVHHYVAHGQYVLLAGEETRTTSGNPSGVGKDKMASVKAALLTANGNVSRYSSVQSRAGGSDNQSRDGLWASCLGPCQSACSTSGVCFFLLVVLSASAELVLRKAVVSSMLNYRWVLMQMLSLLAVFAFTAMSFIKRKDITREMMSVGRSKFFFMAFLDCIHTMCIIMPLGVVSGPSSVLIPQLIVPLGLVCGLACGPVSFCSVHALGILLAGGGVVMSILNELASVEGPQQPEVLANLLVMACASVPAAASLLYKQDFLQKTEMNHWFMNAMVSMFQFLIGVLICPIALRLQYLNTPQLVDAYDVPSNIAEGFRCLVGTDSQATDRCEIKKAVLGAGFPLFVAAIFVSQFAMRKLTISLSEPSDASVRRYSVLPVTPPEKENESESPLAALAKDHVTVDAPYPLEEKKEDGVDAQPASRKCSLSEQASVPSASAPSDSESDDSDSLISSVVSVVPQIAVFLSMVLAYFAFFLPASHLLVERQPPLNALSVLAVLSCLAGMSMCSYRPVQPPKKLEDIWESMELVLDDDANHPVKIY